MDPVPPPSGFTDSFDAASNSEAPPSEPTEASPNASPPVEQGASEGSSHDSRPYSFMAPADKAPDTDFLPFDDDVGASVAEKREEVRSERSVMGRRKSKRLSLPPPAKTVAEEVEEMTEDDQLAQLLHIELRRCLKETGVVEEVGGIIGSEQFAESISSSRDLAQQGITADSLKCGNAATVPRVAAVRPKGDLTLRRQREIEAYTDYTARLAKEHREWKTIAEERARESVTRRKALADAEAGCNVATLRTVHDHLTLPERTLLANGPDLAGHHSSLEAVQRLALQAAEAQAAALQEIQAATASLRRQNDEAYRRYATAASGRAGPNPGARTILRTFLRGC